MNLRLKLSMVAGFGTVLVLHFSGAQQQRAAAAEPGTPAVRTASPDAPAPRAPHPASRTPSEGSAVQPTPAESVPSATPETVQDLAASSFASAVLRLSGEADDLDRLWTDYKQECGVRVARQYDFGREWFSIWDRAAEATINAPACGDALRRLRQAGDKLGREILKARAAAHQAALNPGTEIGMLRWHALQWPQFEDEQPPSLRRGAVSASTRPVADQRSKRQAGRGAASEP